MKIAPLVIANVVSATNVIIVTSAHPVENQQNILVVDSPSLSLNMAIDLEHPSHEEESNWKNLKGKMATFAVHS